MEGVKIAVLVVLGGTLLTAALAITATPAGSTTCPGDNNLKQGVGTAGSPIESGGRLGGTIGRPKAR